MGKKKEVIKYMYEFLMFENFIKSSFKKAVLELWFQIIPLKVFYYFIITADYDYGNSGEVHHLERTCGRKKAEWKYTLAMLHG